MGKGKVGTVREESGMGFVLMSFWDVLSFGRDWLTGQTFEVPSHVKMDLVCEQRIALGDSFTEPFYSLPKRTTTSLCLFVLQKEAVYDFPNMQTACRAAALKGWLS